MRTPPLLVGLRRRLLLRLVANGLVQATAALAAGHFVHAILRSVESPSSVSTTVLVAPGVGLLAAALLLATLRVVEQVDAERFGQHYATEVRLLLFDCLTRTSVRTIQRRSRGALGLRFMGDLKALRQWGSLGLARLAVASVCTVLTLGTLAVMNPSIGATAALIIASGLVALRAMGLRTREAVKEARRRQSYLAANVTEKIASIAVVQVFDQSRREREYLGRQSERVQHALVAQSMYSAMLRSIGDFTAAFASGAVLLVGAWQVLHARASFAEVVAAMSVIGMLLPGLRDVGRAAGYFNAAKVSRLKLDRFLAEPVLVNVIPGAPSLTAGLGRLEFRGITVAGSLDAFSATAPPGQIVAIVGPNGGGKSTLLAVAARLVDPDSGQVLLDDQDIAKHDLASVRRSIGFVSTDLTLLRGSIEKNICYRWPDAPRVAVERVKSLCRIDEAIAELEQGLATRVSDGGSNLSLGQRQRIAMARALLGEPKVLLLDEAEANLDPYSVAVMENVLEAYNGTVLMVTHRCDRAARADLIWYVENGRLLEAGPSAELLHGVGPTARLFDATLRLAI